MHRAKSILAALAAIALSATAVFAAAGASGPAHTATVGLDRAAIASEWSVPVRAESPDTATEPHANKAPEANESPDLATTKAADTTHPDNHGLLVSAAAKTGPQVGFPNHGAYVSSIARQNHGHGAAPETTHGKSGATHPAD